MKYFFVCGDPSGDRWAALAAREIGREPGIEIRAMGGDHLIDAGVHIVEHIDQLSFMGWTDVARKVPSLFHLLRRIKVHISRWQPDTVVLVDNAGFNLRILPWCKKRGYRVVYFIPPKVWASRPRRINLLKKYCDEIIVLYPFEEQYFASQGVDARFYGHPLSEGQRQDHQNTDFRITHKINEHPILTLLPGSRRQEIQHILPTMLEAAMETDFNICISCAPSIDKSFLETFLPPDYPKSEPSIFIIAGDIKTLLANSYLALVTSGTATIEAALEEVPMMVCYKTSTLNYHIAKRLIRTSYISLPNLILNEGAVPELIQDQCTVAELLNHIDHLSKEVHRLDQIKSLKQIKHLILVNNSVFYIASAISGKQLEFRKKL